MKAAAVCLLLFVSLGYARDREFDAIVRSMESEYGTKRLHIPLFGVVNFFVKTIRPAGARDLKLAVFEDVDPFRHPSPERLDDIAQGWNRFIQVQSKRKGERVHIYSRKVKENWELLLTALERDEAVVIRLRLHPDGLARWMDDPVWMARHKGK
jgi:hypothetical protein